MSLLVGALCTMLSPGTLVVGAKSCSCRSLQRPPARRPPGGPAAGSFYAILCNPCNPMYQMYSLSLTLSLSIYIYIYMTHMIHRIAGIAEGCIERAAGRPAARPAQQSGSVGPGLPTVSGPWAKLPCCWAGLAAGRPAALSMQSSAILCIISCVSHIIYIQILYMHISYVYR